MTAATSTNTAIAAATPSNTPIEDATALVKPLQGLLQGINLLGKTTAADLPPQTGADEDPGAQVFEANATAVAKKVALLSLRLAA